MGTSFQSLCFTLVLVLAIAGEAHAFGAGNIASLSRIEGQNWRHGDIEDALLTLFLARIAGGKKFSKLDVQRVYFGNWLRDYSQAVDIGTLKYVSAEAIRILIWVLGFMTFGYGTNEFEVTTERLGCYQPTEHIDNPLGYGEGLDGRDYDRRLRGPVDEERELAIDPRTGLKSYIASEDLDIATSAGLVRRVFRRSIELGRRYARSNNQDDLHEALRLLGTGLHCLEDYAAHSNYTELSLIELGETDVFPHVGRNVMLEIEGARDPVYPIVTGTFGGVDFFHSVLGEVSDKVTQSELQTLEGVISDSQGETPSQSLLKDLLSKIPDGLLADKDSDAEKVDGFKAKADDAKQHNEQISPREPEEWTQFLNDVQRQIYPVLEWHDELIKAINKAIENIPVLPDLIEQVQDQMNIFVFSVLAPYVLPIITQIKTELQTGSSEVIQSSREQQHIVFNDDDSSNPTHSMLSKDHFSNVLNEPAGRIASQVVKWTVPQLMECWDNEDIDIRRTLDRIVTGVFHHPAQREFGRDGAADMHGIMFGTVEEWWNEKSDRERDSLREQLSRHGVLEGRNHKEGVHDSGHGCGKPLSLPKKRGGSGNASSGGNHSPVDGIGKVAADAAGGGAIGGLVGGLVGGIGSMLLDNDSKEDGGFETGRHEHSSSTYGHSEKHYHQEHRRHKSREDYRSESHSSHASRHDYGHEQNSHPRKDDYRHESRDDRPSADNWRREEYRERQSRFGEEGGGNEYSRSETETYKTQHGGHSGYIASHHESSNSRPSYGYGNEGSGYGGYERRGP
ncbi:Het-C domain-containing protein [Aspergillus ruber CBS 135680]|uniref:Het-C-domain-containing protein n=1 Tax=Aspergillus ruber (strain CBS 135680) TaxID=1388766 RepID=A0A017SBY8_ASPRC|nr:Het-C-domain-containing protein [Aspergillus ruber CBS 135680]EYE94139.1 Het-C-domain-containing protein [Aspergillus ruber CBS 135680]